MAEGLPPSAGDTRSEAEPAGFSGALTYLAVAVTVAGLYFGRDVLVPFALAVLLSFLLAPVVHWLRRLRAGRVTAVSAAVLVAFLAIFAFAAVIAEEVSSLAPSLSEYRHNIEAKIRSLPKEIPLGRASTMLHQLHRDLARSESAAAPPAGSAGGRGAAAEQAKPLPVEVQQPELTPLQLAESVVGPLLQPLATAGLVVVLVVLILLEREALRDRLLRLAGVGDLHRTTESMNDAAQRVSRYLLSQLTVNAACGLTVGIGLTVIGIPSPALWGILAILLRFVPYIGIVIAACFPLALAIAIDPGWSLRGVDGAALCRDRARHRECGRAVALCRPHRPVFFCGGRGGGILGLALGPGRAPSVDAADRLSRGSRPARAAPRFSRRDARQRTGADAGRDILSAPARQ